MKFMGSKRAMLENGLGTLIDGEIKQCHRFVDLFCGSGAVTTFVATRASVPVVASDLQAFAVVLAGAVVARDRPLQTQAVERRWVDVATAARNEHRLWSRFSEHARGPITSRTVQQARELSGLGARVGPVLRAYGGYYFSPAQALTIDYLLKYLPARGPERVACLASLIHACSRCAAAPGHTAQPFRPTPRGTYAIANAWNRDPVSLSRDRLHELAGLYAQAKGRARVMDALNGARRVSEGDLVFVDPPYSAVQYSRFYHVLETVARSRCSGVSGAGRYPRLDERPQSAFSRKSDSATVLQTLLARLARRRVRVILTFPKEQASNGLSGDDVCAAAQGAFTVQKEEIVGRFSTLGGNNDHRAPRLASRELVLLLAPK